MKTKLYFLCVFLIIDLMCQIAAEQVSTDTRPITPTEEYGPKDAETLLIIGNRPLA